MKPTKMQTFFAQNWPMRIAVIVMPLLCLGVTTAAYQPIDATLVDRKALVMFVVDLIVAALLGFFVAVLFVSIVLGPIYRARARKNGGPFVPGDRVQILAGPHKGRIALVYSLSQGDCVHVEVGADERARYKDIFFQTQLLREEGAEPRAAENRAKSDPTAPL